MKKLLCIVALLIFPTFSSAATLNVNSVTGDDGNTKLQVEAGTHQWKTLGRALWGSANRSTPNPSEAADAGDTVLVAAGTYTAPDTGSRYSIAFQPVKEGTSESARIIIKAVGTVNLTLSGTSGGPVIGSNAKDYITWDGFTIDETTYTSMESGEQSICMFANAANYGTVKNCTFIGRTTAYANANHAAIFISGSTGNYIYNNTIYNVDGNSGDSNTAGIYSYGASSLLIEHNHIYNSRGGIFLKEEGITDVTVRYNKLHDLEVFGIRNAVSDLENTNILVYQNLIYNITDGYGLMTGYMQGTGNKFVNNTIYNVRGGFFIGGNYNDNQVLWYNNIIHTASTSSVYTEDYGATPYADHDFQHNVYYNAANQYSLDGGGFQTWATWTTTWGKDTTSPASITSDPLFTSAGTNFTLQAGSPAAALGVDILDLDGDSNTSDNIPAGAYITGNETIGVETASASNRQSTAIQATGGLSGVGAQ